MELDTGVGYLSVIDNDIDDNGFVIKDSGERQVFTSGMVRDVETGKEQYHRVLEGPMLLRWVRHLTKGATKYPDSPDGSANWTKAHEELEYRRFKRSALRHFMQWYRGDVDEDHGAAVYFNINGAEHVKEKLNGKSSPAISVHD